MEEIASNARNHNPPEGCTGNRDRAINHKGDLKMKLNAKQTIKQQLTKIMEDGEANAAQVWKGYDASTGENGWHYCMFNSTPQFIGASVSEATKWIDDLASARQSDR